MGKRKQYDYSFKFRCVKEVLIHHRGVKSVAKEEGVEDSQLRLWLGFYKAYGVKGLKRKPNRCYDAFFKLRVLTTIDKEALSLRAACVRFNIATDSTIIRWRRSYEVNGLDGLENNTRGRPKTNHMPPIKRKPRKSNKPLTREEELLLENEALKAENELLKKLQALVQADKKQKPS